MSTTRFTVKLSEDTLAALRELAEITEQEEERDRVAALLEEAVRTYEWMIYQQWQGNRLVVLKPGQAEEEQESVEPLFPEEKKGQVEAYFRKATQG